MEEDIKILEKYANFNEITSTRMLQQAVQNILAEREADKKRIKELEEVDFTNIYISGVTDANKKWRDEIEKKDKIINLMALEGSPVQLEIYIKNNYIPKSVIEEKIYELKQEKYILSSKEAEIMLLQELLESRA